MPERIRHIIALIKLSDRERFIFVTLLVLFVVLWIASKLWDQGREIEKEAYTRVKIELAEEKADNRQLKAELKDCYQFTNSLLKGDLDKFDTIIHTNKEIIETLK